MNPKTYPDPHHDTYSKTVFGFWLYLLTDFVLFSSLFAIYAVLHRNTFGGPTPQETYELDFTLIQTLIFLTCSLTSGIAGAAAHRTNKNLTIGSFVLTFILAAIFLGMGFAEFNHVLQLGASWKTSGFLSAYFTIIGTIDMHVIFGLLWTILLLIPVWREGITSVSLRRLTCLRMFWQFLNIVWIFFFTVIYLMGGV